MSEKNEANFPKIQCFQQYNTFNDFADKSRHGDILLKSEAFYKLRSESVIGAGFCDSESTSFWIAVIAARLAWRFPTFFLVISKSFQ